MPVWLAVAVGGAVGSLARWQAGLWLRAVAPGFPWATLAVNITGSFAIGVIASLPSMREAPEWLRTGLITGVLGGYTTFSAFSLDTVDLWRASPLLAAANVLVHVTVGLAACVAGAWLVRNLSPA